MITLDIDGTLLDYNYSTRTKPVINQELIAKLAADGVEQIALVTNQGGLVFGEQGFRRQDGRGYPVPEDFTNRLFELDQALARHGIAIAGVYICTYHPKADAGWLDATTDKLRRLLRLTHLPCFVYPVDSFRKPSPIMLEIAKASVYYGDSDEDEQAASAAGIPFVRVPRFVGAA